MIKSCMILASLLAAGNAQEPELALTDTQQASGLYLSGDTLTDKAVELTHLLTNADFKQGFLGWTEQHTNLEGFTSGMDYDNSLSPAVVEAYAGYDFQEKDSYSLHQEVTLEQGMYRFSANAFFRYGDSSDCDIKTDGTPRSQAELFAAEVATPIMRLGDPDRATYPNTMRAASAAFKEDEYRNAVIFTLAEPTTITLGARGTFDRNRSWFCMGPVTLQKISIEVLEAELAEHVNAAIAGWQKWEAIAEQATDRTAYDEALAKAMADAQNVQQKEELPAIDEALRQTIMSLIATQPARTGQYDLTSMLCNPSFNTGTTGWTLADNVNQANGTIEMSDQASNEIHQTLAGMPAGQYTVKVQAFCRPRDINGSTAAYEAGESGGRSELFMNGDHAGICDINTGGRHRPSGNDDTYGAGGLFVPNTLGGAARAFAAGGYWNVLRSEMKEEGEIRLGLRHSGAESSNWVPFDNFRLYYGAPKQQIALSKSDKFTISSDTYADVTTDIGLKAGQLNSICLPFDLPASHFKEAYTLAGFDYDATANTATGTLVPVAKLKAGEGYFVTVTEDCTLQADDVLVRATLPDSITSMWEHTAMEGTLGKGMLHHAFLLCDDGTLEYQELRSECPGLQAVVYADIPSPVDKVALQTVDFSDVSFAFYIENSQARSFLSKAEYHSSEAPSVISGYNASGNCRRDQPRSAIVPLPPLDRELTVSYSDRADAKNAGQVTVAAGSETAELRNLYPGRTYRYTVTDGDSTVSRGQFTTEGTLRMIKASTGSNMRDMGGWKTYGGRQLNYGLLYRGGEMNAKHVMSDADRAELRRVGIAAELDLRHDGEVRDIDMSVSPLGEDVHFLFINQTVYNEDALQETRWYRDSFRFILSSLREGFPLYYHCIWGADRTGAMALVLEGLCGVTLDQMYKDYELTSFSIAGMRKKNGIDSKLDYIRSFDGATLQECFMNYWHDAVGISTEDLYDFIGIMGGDSDIITTIADDNTATKAKPPVYYGIDGTRRATLHRGINIVRHANGRTEKLVTP